MNQITQKIKPTFKVYRDGEYSRVETYSPIIKREVTRLLEKTNLFFGLNHWPSDQELAEALQQQ
jgi:hypothetical protein